MKNENFERKKPARFASRAEKDQRPEELAEGLIEGRNALTEALKSGRTIDKLYVAEGSTEFTVSRLLPTVA